MVVKNEDIIPYKRARFTTRLPVGRSYVASHFWLAAEDDGVWRVGFTKFATRMLGELVEHGFEVEAGETVTVGQTIGWLEGLKATSDLYCAAAGTFVGGNPDLAKDGESFHRDPYYGGWLYRVRGEPAADALDVHGYSDFLNDTIDRMTGESA